jgi:hypothetical protein
MLSNVAYRATAWSTLKSGDLIPWTIIVQIEKKWLGFRNLLEKLEKLIVAINLFLIFEGL